MREKIVGIILLFIVIGFVITNSVLLDRKIAETTDMVCAFNIDKSDITGAKIKAEELFEAFEERERYISLTVSHDDLTNIENSFVDLIGYLSIGDVYNAAVAKNRLIHSLEHLRRLSGFNFDAIIETLSYPR